MNQPIVKSFEESEPADRQYVSRVRRLAMRLDMRSGALWLCLLLYLIQTLPFLSYRWVTDESWYAAPAYSLSQNHGLKDPAIGPNDIENHLDARPPGTALIIACFFKLFGTNQITARLGSVLAGALLVILIYFLSRAYLDSAGVFTATLLVATDNLLVLTARTARPEALTIAVIFLSLFCAFKYQREGRLIWAALCGVLLAAGTMFHITLLGYILSAGILLIAIDNSRGHPWWRGLLTGLGAFLAGLSPFALWISRAPLGREGFEAEYLSRAGAGPLLIRLLGEKRRYSDLIGLNMMRGHGFERLPLRLPIPLLFIFATWLLWKYRRRWFYAELLLLLPSVAWLIYTVNKTSRYLVLLAPIFALVLGAAVTLTASKKTLRHGLILASGLASVAQFGVNIVLLHSAIKANYNQVANELRRAIPADETVYGTITFWMALHDRSYISYERTTPQMAADVYRTRYFVSGDRMMTAADNYGDERFYRELNEQMSQIAQHSDLVTLIHDDYYGNLSVYRLRR